MQSNGFVDNCSNFGQIEVCYGFKIQTGLASLNPAESVTASFKQVASLPDAPNVEAEIGFVSRQADDKPFLFAAAGLDRPLSRNR